LSLTRAVDRRQLEKLMLEGLCRGHHTQFPRKMPKSCSWQGRL
jgi:hypothetical protein